MPTYVVLGKISQKGMESVKEVPKRRAAAEQMGAAMGVTLRSWFLTMGRFDLVFVVDAPDGETVARFLLQVGSWGTLSTQTLRAFGPDEADALIRSL